MATVSTTTRLAGAIAASLLASLAPVSSSPVRAAPATCVQQRPVERAVLGLRRDNALVHVEHTCAGWQTPVVIEGVRVLATDLVEDAGPAVAVLQVAQAEQPAFERRVRVGDRLGKRWVVVAATDGVVLIDDAGTLLAALDQRPVDTWRLTWHSPFSLIGVPAAVPATAAPAGKPAKPARATPAATKKPQVRKK